MNDACNMPSASSGLTHNENRHGRGRGEPDLLKHPPVGWAEPDQTVEPKLFLELSADLKELDVKLTSG
jgi:hypothetical protein